MTHLPVACKSKTHVSIRIFMESQHNINKLVQKNRKKLRNQLMIAINMLIQKKYKNVGDIWNNQNGTVRTKPKTLKSLIKSALNFSLNLKMLKQKFVLVTWNNYRCKTLQAFCDLVRPDVLFLFNLQANNNKYIQYCKNLLKQGDKVLYTSKTQKCCFPAIVFFLKKCVYYALFNKVNS